MLRPHRDDSFHMARLTEGRQTPCQGRGREDAVPRLLDADGARTVGDGLSEMRRLIDPEGRQWTLIFLP